MGPVANSVYQTLSASAPLNAVLTGGVHATTLDRAATPGAYDDVGRPKPAAVVRDRGEDAAAFGLSTAFAGFPQV